MRGGAVLTVKSSIHFFLSFLIFVFIVVPLQLLAWPCLAIALATRWDGRAFFFGNSKHGRATNHYLVPTNGNYWKELSWMGWRNPVYNLTKHYLGIPMKGEYLLCGDEAIGDKIKGGYYQISMGLAWEYYIIIPYSILGHKRCFRLRFGWKISGNDTGLAEFVFSLNPWKSYIGA